MRRGPNGPANTSSSPMMEARMLSIRRSADVCMATCVGASHVLCALGRALCHCAPRQAASKHAISHEIQVPPGCERGYHERAMAHDKLHDSILDAVGHTPLIKLSRIGRNLPCELVGKCEFMNPGGSVKDRI